MANLKGIRLFRHIFPLTGIKQPSVLSTALGAGFYWASGFQVTRASITTSSTKFDDGSLGDQTTYEEVIAVNGALSIRRIYSGNQDPSVNNEFDIQIAYVGAITVATDLKIERWDGSAWTSDFVSGINPITLSTQASLTQAQIMCTLDGITPFNEVRISLRSTVQIRISDIRLVTGGG